MIIGKSIALSGKGLVPQIVVNCTETGCTIDILQNEIILQTYTYQGSETTMNIHCKIQFIAQGTYSANVSGCRIMGTGTGEYYIDSKPASEQPVSRITEFTSAFPLNPVSQKFAVCHRADYQQDLVAWIYSIWLS